MHAQQFGGDAVLPAASGPVETTPLYSTTPVPAPATLVGSDTEPAAVPQMATGEWITSSEFQKDSLVHLIHHYFIINCF